MILGLQRLAVDGLEKRPGNYRTGPIEIGGSSHEPPPSRAVPRLVEDLCDYVSSEWERASAFHLTAFVMWRLNWIHPFSNGNGRTSRAVSYLILCAKLGYLLPGQKTVPELISGDKGPYYQALEAADAAGLAGSLDVSAMEHLLEQLLAQQLVDIVSQASDS